MHFETIIEVKARSELLVVRKTVNASAIEALRRC